MKLLPTGLQAHLDTGATTLCFCWKLTRRDDLVLGFTDHDRLLQFDSVGFEPTSGFTSTVIESSLGLSVDNMNALGALSATALSEDDLAAGDFDDAGIEIYRVNWGNIDQRVLLRKGNLGEVKRGRTAFEAEVRGLAHKLNQPIGRLFHYGCDVDLGAARCGVDLEGSAFKGVGTILDISKQRRIFTTTGLDSFETGWFERGKIGFTSGANQTRQMEVKRHTKTGASVVIELWQEMPDDFAQNDDFIITAGCDKQFATCKAKFSNTVNFRGFPHMPGNDFVLSTPDQGGKNDGGSRFN